MKDFLFEFYEESTLKKNRRYEMLNTCLPYVVNHGIYHITLKSIAGLIGIERRTLYDYYRTKEELIVDLAFIAVNQLNEQYALIADMIEITHRDQGSQALLKQTLESIATVVYEKHSKLFNFLTEFDAFYYTLDSSDPAFIQYQKVVTTFKNKYHYLDKGITQLIDEYQIKSVSKSELIEVIEQSFHAYLARILIKECESSRYKISNIKYFINILVEGLPVLK